MLGFAIIAFGARNEFCNGLILSHRGQTIDGKSVKKFKILIINHLGILKLLVLLLGINFLIAAHCTTLLPGSQCKQIKSYSQASQDQFVYLILYKLMDKQDNGYYIEIGAGHPIESNNTYLFEKDLGWKGISIDISDGHKQLWHSIRQNLLLIEDATQTDYWSILKLFPQVIDYLSLDIDGCYDKILHRMPFNHYIFKVITIEHDSYRLGNEYKKKEREILTAAGYYLLCSDVTVFFNGADCVFEDWWIHPSVFSADMLSRLTSLDLNAKNHSQIIDMLQNCLKNVY